MGIGTSAPSRAPTPAPTLQPTNNPTTATPTLNPTNSPTTATPTTAAPTPCVISCHDQCGVDFYVCGLTHACQRQWAACQNNCTCPAP